jgi:hypothetical protein
VRTPSTLITRTASTSSTCVPAQTSI